MKNVRPRRNELVGGSEITVRQVAADSVSAEEAAIELDLSIVQLLEMARQGHLWSFLVRGKWCVPRIQFHDGWLLPGWEQVCGLVPAAAPPVSVFQFLVIERDELGGQSVRDWLAGGESVGPVLELARVWPGS